MAELDIHFRPRTPHFGPIGVGVAILLISGAAYRLAEARFGLQSASVPIAPGTLGQFPLRVGGWEGHDVPLSERIVRATETDDHLNRTYIRARSGEAVSFYIAYGVRLRDLAPHRPEVCYPGAGWVLDNTEDTELQGDDGGRVPCRILRFHHSGLDANRLTVLNYYLVDGDYCPDVRLLRWRSGEARTGGHYAAQIQITSSVSMYGERADSLIREFGALTANRTRDLIEREVQRATTRPAGAKER